MESRAVSITKRKLSRKSQFRQFKERKNTTTSNRLRLSDINVKTRLKSISKDTNQLLFDMNSIYNKNFNPNQQILAKDLTNVLLNGITESFNLKNESVYIDSDCIVVKECLKHDMYQLPIKPFFKLKKRAPILFDAFVFFISNCTIPIIDSKSSDSVLLNDFTIEHLTCLLEDKISKEEKQHIKEGISSFMKTKKISDNFSVKMTKKKIIKQLKSYNPKKEIFIFLKETFLKWLDLDFSFINTYPFEYFDDEKFKKHIDKNFSDEDDESEYYLDDYETEFYDFNEFIFFQYNDNECINSEINDAFSNIYNNYQITTPCWFINKEQENSHIKKSIFEFENFSEEYFIIIELLKAL